MKVKKIKKKIGLVLGSGGARGFCHIGVLEVLQKYDIPVHIVTGCSMGAMIGGGLAAGVTVEKMHQISNSVSNNTVFDVDVFRMWREGGLAKGERAMTLYKKYVGEKLIEDCEIKFACVAAEMTEQKLHVFTTGTLWKAVRASMSIPGVFYPMRMDDKVFVDGGLLKRMPIQEARDLGADFIIAVDAIGAPHETSEFNSLVKVLELSYQMMDWRTAQYEGDEADILIVPDMGEKSSFRFKSNEEAIQAGRDAALAALPQIFEKLKIKMPPDEIRLLSGAKGGEV